MQMQQICHYAITIETLLRTEQIQEAVIPDIVALEQAVGILGLVGLLALNGPKPPGIINH